MPSEPVTQASTSTEKEQTAVKPETEPERPTSDSAAQLSSTPLSPPPSSIPSSPPIALTEMAPAKGQMGPPAQTASSGRKRQRSQPETAPTESSTTARSKVDAPPSQGKPEDKNIDSPTTVVLESSVKQQPPPSGAIAPVETPNQSTKSSQRVPPQSAQRDEDEHEDSPDTGEPHEAIEPFDWQDLEMRYHQKMEEISNAEANNHAEFTDLLNYFTIWADAGASKEVDRGFKRLKTQLTYVRHEEDELEKKRLHYIKVVEAFKKVEVLLSEPDWAEGIVALLQGKTGLRQRVPTQQTRTLKRKRSSPTYPNIDTDDWGPYVVEDIDMGRYSHRELHPGRCVIL